MHYLLFLCTLHACRAVTAMKEKRKLTRQTWEAGCGCGGNTWPCIPAGLERHVCERLPDWESARAVLHQRQSQAQAHAQTCQTVGACAGAAGASTACGLPHSQTCEIKGFNNVHLHGLVPCSHFIPRFLLHLSCLVLCTVYC